MADTSSTPSVAMLEALFERLPVEKQAPELLTRRIRIVTEDGRTVFAFMRAGSGPLAFGGWEATLKTKDGTDEVQEPEWGYFLIASETPESPLFVISQKGLLGALRTAELEDRPAEDSGE